jgi:hypothetical protein
MLMISTQLKQAMDSGSAFEQYEEGPILFRPTYRYDLYSDSYDTSEKMRTPAWTGRSHSSCSSNFNKRTISDRVLFRGEGLNCLVYNRAELKSSDHRPGKDFPMSVMSWPTQWLVFAIFQAKVRIIDKEKREKLFRTLFEESRNALPGEKLVEKLSAISLTGTNITRESFL